MFERSQPGAIARRGLLRVGLAVAGALALSWRARPAPAAEPAQVGIDNFTFSPAALTVPAGAGVVWTNHDDIPHQIVCLAAKARSPVLDTGQSFSFRFDQPGRFDYFCGLHPHMQGTVTVSG